MMYAIPWLVAASLVLQRHDDLCNAFPVSAEHSHAASATAVFRSKSSVTALHMHSEDEHGDFFDVETARRQLESLVTGGGGGGGAPSMPERPRQQLSEDPQPRSAYSSVVVSPDDFSSLPETPVLDVALPARPPLTTIERERRRAELDLLATLDEGDESLSDIWELWFSERGSQAAALLHRADDLMNGGQEDWAEAEKILRDLIQDYSVRWAEPVNRLATLMYLQGRHEDAVILNKIVLSVKPWHFGALSHIVMVNAALGDNHSARQWAAFRLPTFSSNGSNRRRVKWVKRAVVEATMLLKEGEERLADAFGNPDQSWIEMQSKIRQMYDNDPDAWQ